MRLIFAGTPAFAQAALREILNAGHEVALVLTRPDRPAGRGLQPKASEVKTLAEKCGLPVVQPQALKSDDTLATLRAANASAMVVAAYGLILPQVVLDLFPLGCINIHASLLPRWRGAAPIQRAILAGDSETGISIMRMETGLDTGPVYATQRIAIASDATAGSLHDELAPVGGRCIVRILGEIEQGNMIAVPQPAEGVSYARKIEKSEARIDWTRPALEIERMVRAFNPFPVASTTVRGAGLRVWRAMAVHGAQQEPGQVIEAVEAGILVACGEGALLIHELQRAGGKRLSAEQFLRGSNLSPGEGLGT